MTKAKMDYLWAPKSEGVVSNLFDTLGIAKVGDSERYPAGIKYDALIAINDVLQSNETMQSMVGTRLWDLQSKRTPAEKVKAEPDAIVQALQSGAIDEDALKKAMRKAGLLK